MPVKKYLQQYAEMETALLQNWPGNDYRHTLVIPCYRESADFLRHLRTLFSRHNLLLIVVVNQPVSVDGTPNAELLSTITGSGDNRWHNGNLSLRSWGENGGLLLVDRSSGERRLPPKQGVGLARKIGCDLAAQLIEREFVRNRWIHSTDADAQLPSDYFSNLPDSRQYSAALYPFIHERGNSPVHRAVHLYEQALHYYVDGLHRAGSPWAFHTIGSILAISARHYCAARGFPKRAAGEDFYLLNKLGKLAPVAQLSDRAPVRIAARLSDRVPFGTGPATAKIVSQLENGIEPTWYAPQVFSELRDFLGEAVGATEQVSGNERWRDALEELGWEKFLTHCRRQKLTGARKVSVFHHWFDAFRTLRFIHLMQHSWHPPQPLRGVLAQAAINC